MKLIEKQLPDKLIIQINNEELQMLRGGIRETLEAVEAWEFHTRLGFTQNEFRRIQQVLKDLDTL